MNIQNWIVAMLISFAVLGSAAGADKTQSESAQPTQQQLASESEDDSELDFWLNIAGIAGVWAAVLVALFGPKFWEQFHRPKISIRCGKLVGQRIPIQSPAIDIEPVGEFFRMWVKNKGRQTARRVHVYAAKLLKRDQAGNLKESETFLPLCLVWSHRQPGTVYMDLAPEMGWFCDIGFVPSDESALVDEKTPRPIVDRVASNDHRHMFLTLETQPNSGTHILGPGEYELLLIIGADNAKPKRAQIRIHHQGIVKYGEDEITFKTSVSADQTK